jgi:Holliday junction DNA helicase RuvA
VIESIRGRLTQVAADHVIVEVGGLGLRVQVPAGVSAELNRLELTSADAAEVRLATHLLIREDGWQLFGFREEPQRDAFRVLIGITGIGPRLAMSLLSHLTLAELIEAVESNDQIRFQSVPGVGKRTAARIAVELAGKLQGATGAAALNAVAGSAARDAADALVALGLAPAEAAGLVRAVTRDDGAPSGTAGIVAAALSRRSARG